MAAMCKDAKLTRRRLLGVRAASARIGPHGASWVRAVSCSAPLEMS